MENAELDVALEELESRLERLRALYEQYFMGIERIEPAIPRKDIDRRIYVLRREKIRNTAKRFKLQTIISRYNTFQQYWQRTCREIEAGTYKRHVIRAERIAPGKMLTIAARKRLGRSAFDSVPPEEAARDVQGSRPSSAHPPSAPPIAAVAPAARPAPPPKPQRVAKPAAANAPADPGPAGAAAPPPTKPLPAASRAFESLNLDMDFMGDWDPSQTTAKNSPPKREPSGPGPLKALAPPLPPTRKAQPATAIAPPKPATAPTPPRASPAAVPAPAHHTSSVPPRPAAPARPPTAALKPTLPKLGAAPLAKPTAPAANPAAAAALSDQRVRELHARLIEAKRQTQDASAVSIEGLAKSLKATEAKLREQHKNRKIDFDVVIKDGKAVLKPIVR